MVIENSRNGKVKNKENYDKREAIRGLVCLISKPCTKRYKLVFEMFLKHLNGKKKRNRRKRKSM